VRLLRFYWKRLVSFRGLSRMVISLTLFSFFLFPNLQSFRFMEPVLSPSRALTSLCLLSLPELRAVPPAQRSPSSHLITPTLRPPSSQKEFFPFPRQWRQSVFKTPSSQNSCGPVVRDLLFQPPEGVAVSLRNSPLSFPVRSF